MINIKTLRKHAGKTIKDMADLCDVGASTYARWEKDTDNIPHGLWLEIIEYLETAIRVKETTMKKIGRVTVRTGYEKRDLSKLHVPVPEGLSERFQPERPMSYEDWERWDQQGIEPYPGFAEAYHRWLAQWEKIGQADREARGIKDVVVNMPDIVPTYDENGEPTNVDLPELVVTGDGVDKDAYVGVNRPDPGDPDTLPTQEEVDALLDSMPRSGEPDVYED